jgi:iron(III) transport system permease protein
MWSGTPVALVLVATLAYLVVVPLVRLQALALNGHAYRAAFSEPGVWTACRMTLWLALGSLAIAAVFGTALALAAATLPPKLRLLRIVPVMPILLPATSSVLGWAFLFSPHPGYFNQLLRHLPWWSHQFYGPVNVYSITWIVIITGLALTSFMYLFVSASIENLDVSLLEAAQVCGSSRTDAFFRVMLPLMRPALVYGGGVCLLLGLGQFTAPLFLGLQSGTRVLTTLMFSSTQSIPPTYSVAAALGSPILGFALVVIVLNKVLLKNQTRFVTHGGRGFRPLGHTSKVGVAAIILYGLIACLMPILALLFVAFSPYWSGTIDFHILTTKNFAEILHNPEVTNAIETTVITAAAAIAIAIPIGYIAAELLHNRRTGRTWRWLVDLAVTIPLAIPPVIFGVAFLLTYTHGPFVLYGTRWVLVLVYVTITIPFATRMQLSARLSLGHAYMEAARVSGAGALRAHATVLAPLMRGACIGAGCLMFIILSHEFAASMLVRAPTVQVMGTLLYDYYINGVYPQVAAMALVMVGVTSAGVILAFILGGSDVFRRL